MCQVVHVRYAVARPSVVALTVHRTQSVEIFGNV